MTREQTEADYRRAMDRYAEVGVDTEQALGLLATVPISLHCWQGDDVGGFERAGATLSGGGIQVTGSHPGKARTIGELRDDLAKAFSLIPGKHRLNLHAMYGDFGGKATDRDEIEPDHYRSWVGWAQRHGLGLDFNATCFSHPKAESGFTLSDRDPATRLFWIEHVKRCRQVSAFMGRELGTPCLHNLWIPDGAKDIAVDRFERRSILRDALDEIYSVEHPAAEMKDAVEGKLFGIGSESFVVGSYDFYLCYALQRRKILCLDLGHFHPTESVADKVSALLGFCDELLLHVSRGIRWDSDHVVMLTDDLRDLASEIIRADALGRVHLALDFFDASLSRVGAWAIGARAALKAILCALLEPAAALRNAEAARDGFARLAWLEEAKALPWGAVWDYYCLTRGVPVGGELMDEVQHYEQSVTLRRA
ncbi:MAG: L-rhamnose isomerase [Armatimonadota bacterium]